MSRNPSLAGCWLRIIRAARYIDEANNLIAAFAADCEERIFNSYNSDTGQYRPFFLPDIPVHLPLAISDAIHNFRASLDYLVYELAFKDSGRIQHGTQFPIETHKKSKAPNGNKVGFDIVVDRYLKGISQPHRDIIESLQPYRGTKWTETLRDISNPDKHRELIPVKRGDTVNFWQHSVDRGKTLPTGETIKVNATNAILINLPQGNIGIVSTLYALKASIEDTINLFNSEFEIV